MKMKILAILFLIFLSPIWAGSMQFGGFASPAMLDQLTRNTPELAKQFVILDFYWHIAADNLEEWVGLRSKLKGEVGLYQSACMAMPGALDLYPPTKFPTNLCSADWFLRDASGRKVNWPGDLFRSFLDMRKREARTEIIRVMVIRAQVLGLKTLCIDNCYYGTAPMTGFPMTATDWTAAMMEFYKELWAAAGSANLRVVLNVATPADQIPAAFRAIAPYADGLMTEMAVHPNMRSPENLARELLGYEIVLAQGRRVLLIPRYATDESFALAAIRPLAKKYPGRIHCTAAGPVHAQPLYDLGVSQ
jgi:hypothetical protein